MCEAAGEAQVQPAKPVVQPTVGRMVYYKSYGTPKGEFKPENRAAVVTAVHLEQPSTQDGEASGVVESVDLCVLNPTGMFFNQRVKQGQEGGQWDWMPFQKDQMARLAKEESAKA